MKKHKKMLKLAAKGKLPKQINDSSGICLDTFKELYNRGLVDAIDCSSADGDGYIEPKITMAGREYLDNMKQSSFVSKVNNCFNDRLAQAVATILFILLVLLISLVVELV